MYVLLLFSIYTTSIFLKFLLQLKAKSHKERVRYGSCRIQWNLLWWSFYMYDKCNLNLNLNNTEKLTFEIWKNLMVPCIRTSKRFIRQWKCTTILMFRINNTFVKAILKRWNIFTSRCRIIIVGKILLKSVRVAPEACLVSENSRYSRGWPQSSQWNRKFMIILTRAVASLWIRAFYFYRGRLFQPMRFEFVSLTSSRGYERCVLFHSNETNYRCGE